VIRRLIVATVLAACVTVSISSSARARQSERASSAIESRIAVGGASLYAREVGHGQPIVILHGGPDFDHAYFLPDLDRLADGYRLIYYDQRGRGKSAEHVGPDDVSLASDIDDLDKLRQHFKLESMTLLGHSWGAVLALEYALRHPGAVSRLILLNPAPASASDVALFRKTYLEKLGDAAMARQKEIIASRAYQEGEPEAVIARYRIHFRPALARSADYERLMKAMNAAFVSQGKQGILEARAAENSLMRDTWQVPGYDLLPRLASLKMPALVIAGDHDFIPIETVAHIAQALPGATFVTLKNCGHFSYMECSVDVRKALDDFVRSR